MNYYELLNCPQTASPEQIQTEFRALAKSAHPDKLIDSTDGNAKAEVRDFALLTQARDVLLDASLRDLYDRWLLSQMPVSFQDFVQKQKLLGSSTHFSIDKKCSNMLQTEPQVKPWKRGSLKPNTSLLGQFRENTI